MISVTLPISNHEEVRRCVVEALLRYTTMELVGAKYPESNKSYDSISLGDIELVIKFEDYDLGILAEATPRLHVDGDKITIVLWFELIKDGARIPIKGFCEDGTEKFEDGSEYAVLSTTSQESHIKLMFAELGGSIPDDWEPEI